MKAFAIWWILGFVAVTLWSDSAGIGVLGGFATWWITVQLWWRRICPKCDGHPRFYDWSDGTNFRPCPECAGRGWVPRTFAVGRE